MGTFAENLTILKWGAALLASGSFVAWYLRRVNRELDLDDPWESLLFVLSLIAVGLAGLGGVMTVPAAGILLYLSFGSVWLLVPLALVVALVVFVERHVRAARRNR